MPPRAKPSPANAAAATESKVYVVVDSEGKIDSVHATSTSANTCAEAKDDHEVESYVLQGGSVNIIEAAKEKAAPRSRAKAAPKKAVKAEEEDEEDEDNEEPEEEEVPEVKKKPAAKAKANTAAKKTTPVAEQRAANASKPAAKDAGKDLADNIKALLAGSGDTLAGMTIVVTGVPPTLGRKNAETLVKNYGGKLTKSLSKNTNYVVVGNDAGPKKLDQISDLGVTTWNEDELIEFLENGKDSDADEGGDKRSADEVEEDEEEEEEKPAKKKSKKRA